MELLGQYAQGWGTGDTEKILGAAADNFTFKDPEEEVPRKNFSGYHKGFCAKYGSTMQITGVVAHFIGDNLVACCVWEAGELKGTGLITVGSQGVEREEVAIL